MDEAAKPAQQEQAGDRPPERRTVPEKVPETGGPAGPEPTRYGDWERGGRCIDF